MLTRAYDIQSFIIPIRSRFVVDGMFGSMLSQCLEASFSFSSEEDVAMTIAPAATVNFSAKLSGGQVRDYNIDKGSNCQRNAASAENENKITRFDWLRSIQSIVVLTTVRERRAFFIG